MLRWVLEMMGLGREKSVVAVVGWYDLRLMTFFEWRIILFCFHHVFHCRLYESTYVHSS